MSVYRIGLANVKPPLQPEESLQIVLQAMEEAAAGGAEILCFPECLLPGYRLDHVESKPDQSWLEQAWAVVDAKAAEQQLTVILGTERVTDNGRLITARVTTSDGTLGGFQDKVQLDPSEEQAFVPGSNRNIFHHKELTFGIVICHEGWRYPETVRWAARRGAHIVFHPHYELVENSEYLPRQFADPENGFHEKAALCRAAENGCYFATVNCALQGATTTSAFIAPSGNLLTYQPYGQSGLLFGEIDTALADCTLANRLKSID